MVELESQMDFLMAKQNYVSFGVQLIAGQPMQAGLCYKFSAIFSVWSKTGLLNPVWSKEVQRLEGVLATLLLLLQNVIIKAT